MTIHRAGLRNHPIRGNTLRGFLYLYSSSLDFKMRRGQWYTSINVNIDFCNIKQVSSCSHLWVFPAFEIRLKDGTLYKFVCPNRNYIVSEINKVICAE